MRPLIDKGHLFLAQPPLYRIDLGKQTLWALDDLHKERLIKSNAKGNAKPNITRFKGLGEMNPDTLKTTTLDPRSRQTLRVTVKDGEQLSTDQVITDLMGKDVAARFKMITENAADIGELDV
jgi:DNA gyrase subunit B/topoisomerase-4 subunit B